MEWNKPLWQWDKKNAEDFRLSEPNWSTDIQLHSLNRPQNEFISDLKIVSNDKNPSSHNHNKGQESSNKCIAYKFS